MAFTHFDALREDKSNQKSSKYSMTRRTHMKFALMDNTSNEECFCLYFIHFRRINSTQSYYPTAQSREQITHE